MSLEGIQMMDITNLKSNFDLKKILEVEMEMLNLRMDQKRFSNS